MYLTSSMHNCILYLYNIHILLFQKVQTTNIKFKSPHTHVSNVRDIKLLVPNTLEKLAERLRKCGIDTSLVERSKINDSQYIIHLIETKSLYFIAFGHAFSKVISKINIYI